MTHGLSHFSGAIAAWLCLAPVAFARKPLSMPSTVAPASIPVHYIANLSVFVIWITAASSWPWARASGVLQILRAYIGSIVRAVAGLSEYGNRFGMDSDSCTGARALSRMRRATG